MSIKYIIMDKKDKKMIMLNKSVNILDYGISEADMFNTKEDANQWIINNLNKENNFKAYEVYIDICIEPC